MPNPNPIDGRYQHTIDADQRNAKYRKIIQAIIAEHTDCFRCRMLNFCEPKCVSYRLIVSVLNTTGVPTPAVARRGIEIKQHKLLPENTPDEMVPHVRKILNSIQTGTWDSIQLKRTLRLQGSKGKRKGTV